MIKPIDLQELPPDVTRAEREYLEQLEQENEDPSKQHRRIIRCWIDDQYRPVLFYEPTHEVFQTILSEIAPIWAKSQVMPACICPNRYYLSLLSLETVKASVSNFQFTPQIFVILKEKKVPRNVLQRLKDIKNQRFFSMQEASDAIITILQDILTEEQIQKHGDVILQHLKQTGIDEKYRGKRLKELQTVLDEFHEHVPQKPYPPTDKECPHCHLPYQYSLLELLPHEHGAIQRMADALVGAPVMFRDIPKVFEALELWLFASDTELFTKKKLATVTMTGLLMTQAKQFIQTMKQDMLTRFGETVETTLDTPASAGSSLESPPPPVPADLPQDN
jgi:hypothetical protein